MKVLCFFQKDFFFKQLNSSNALEKIRKEYPDSAEARHFVDFISSTERGIMPGDPALIALGGNHLNDNDEERP